MKNKITHKSLRNVLAIVLGCALLVAGISVIPKDADYVDASGTVTDLVAGTSCVQVFSNEDFKTYRGTMNTAPESPTGYRGWLFAGWFTTAACSTAADTETEDSVYAKFVSPDVLIVGCQTSSNASKETTTDGSDSARLRLVTTVDSAAYKQVGFTVTGSKKVPKTYWGTTVYSSIVTADADVAYDKTPDVFNDNSKYFYTLKFKNLKVDTPYTVTPCWETLDGTVVNGVTRYVRLSDSWNEYVNVPVRLYSGEEVGAGYMQIKVPEGYTFAGVDTFDAGTIFEQMKVSYDETNRIITCAGILQDVGEDKIADGMYLNLRFTTTETENTDKLGAFEVSNLDFCNVLEESVDTVEAQAVCLNFN